MIARKWAGLRRFKSSRNDKDPRTIGRPIEPTLSGLVSYYRPRGRDFLFTVHPVIDEVVQ